jgi:hypothetical protein
MGLFRESSWGHFPTPDLAAGSGRQSQKFHIPPGCRPAPRVRRLPAHAWANFAEIDPEADSGIFREPAPRARVGEGRVTSDVTTVTPGSPRTRGREYRYHGTTFR